MLDVKKILAKVVNRINPINTFVLETVTVANRLTMSANSFSNQALTITKQGYYPLAVVGYQFEYVSGSSLVANAYALKLTDANNGSGKVHLYIGNVGTKSITINVYAQVLWAKVGG